MHKQLENFSPKRDDVPIFVYGMKPGYYDVVKSEIAALQDSRLTMLNPMDEFNL